LANKGEQQQYLINPFHNLTKTSSSATVGGGAAEAAVATATQIAAVVGRM